MLYGLITAKPRQKVVSREADDVIRFDVEFKTSYSRSNRCGRTREKIQTVSDAVKCFELLKTFYRVQPQVAHVVKTCNTRKAHVKHT